MVELHVINYTNPILNSSSGLSKSFFYCEMKDWSILHWLDLIFSAIMPFLLMITFTCFTVKFIFQSRKNVSRSTTTSQASSNSTASNSKSKDLQFAVNSVSLVVCFLLLTGPRYVFYIFYDYFNKQGTNWTIAYSVDYITYSLYSLNYGMTFFLSVKVNTMFRNEFCGLISEVSRYFRFY